MEIRPALTRASHLNDYISVLRDIGAPVDRELARSRLPPCIEETPDLYVSIPVAMEWIARTGRDCEPMELGLLAAQKASMSSMRHDMHSAIMTAQTGLLRLETVVALCRIEDSVLVMNVRPEADNLRVICSMVGLDRHPFICIGEWLDLHAIISVVRSVAGPSWSPSELCFVSSCRPAQAVYAAFPNTRILVGQPYTSIVIARTDLARLSLAQPVSTPDLSASLASGAVHDKQPEAWEFVSLMRMLIQPYLSGGRPDVTSAAELAGMSARTLQRRLKRCGSSFSKILQEARFELACAYLGNPGMKVIDVAMTAGYENPQNFTRAFRRFTGVTPSQYRNHGLGLDHHSGRVMGPHESEGPGIR